MQKEILNRPIHFFYIYIIIFIFTSLVLFNFFYFKFNFIFFWTSKTLLHPQSTLFTFVLILIFNLFSFSVLWNLCSNFRYLLTAAVGCLSHALSNEISFYYQQNSTSLNISPNAFLPSLVQSYNFSKNKKKMLLRLHSSQICVYKKFNLKIEFWSISLYSIRLPCYSGQFRSDQFVW